MADVNTPSLMPSVETQMNYQVFGITKMVEAKTYVYRQFRDGAKNIVLNFLLNLTNYT